MSMVYVAMGASGIVFVGDGVACDTGIRETFADVVDHVVPVADRPELVHAEGNLQRLCHGHHNGLKARLEAFARAGRGR